MKVHIVLDTEQVGGLTFEHLPNLVYGCEAAVEGLDGADRWITHIEISYDQTNPMFTISYVNHEGKMSSRKIRIGESNNPSFPSEVAVAERLGEELEVLVTECSPRQKKGKVRLVYSNP